MIGLTRGNADQGVVAPLEPNARRVKSQVIARTRSRHHVLGGAPISPTTRSPTTDIRHGSRLACYLGG